MLSGLRTLFPEGCRATDPQGGYFLWLHMPEDIESLALHHAALQRGIWVVPGPLFSPNGGFEHCVRLNYGLDWQPAFDDALLTLSQIVRSMLH